MAQDRDDRWPVLEHLLGVSDFHRRDQLGLKIAGTLDLQLDFQLERDVLRRLFIEHVIDREHLPFVEEHLQQRDQRFGFPGAGRALPPLSWPGEAGAQGPHKVQRGYLPRQTYSAHWIADPAFERAVARFLDEERDSVRYEMGARGRHSPFREDDAS